VPEAMMSYLAKLKIFGIAILQKLMVKGIAALLILLSLSIVGYLNRTTMKDCIVAIWAFLNTEHTITTSGIRFVFYFSLPFLIPLLLAMLFWFYLRSSSKLYRKKHDIVRILAQWIMDNQDKLAEGQVVHFRVLDIELKLKKGSARKYLKRILDNHPTLCIEMGKKEKLTALVRTRR
jgi:hypothetical protein